MTIQKYCKRCGKETRHRKLKQTKFFTQCLMAAITNFNVDLREPEYECNNCGREE